MCLCTLSPPRTVLIAQVETDYLRAPAVSRAVSTSKQRPRGSKPQPMMLDRNTALVASALFCTNVFAVTEPAVCLKDVQQGIVEVINDFVQTANDTMMEYTATRLSFTQCLFKSVNYTAPQCENKALPVVLMAASVAGLPSAVPSACSSSTGRSTCMQWKAL